MSEDRNDPSGEPEVGTLAEEAAKLLGVLGGWAKDAAQEAEEHLATGAPECSYCPVCRAVHAVRDLNPEVRAHLASAATSALQALAGLAAATTGPGRSAAAGGVEHIDLDEDGDWPEETEPEPEGEDR